MELYSPSHKLWIPIVGEAPFSIEAENQLQNLEEYTVGNSFDCEILLTDETSQIVKNQEYVYLYHKKSPLYWGRLIWAGGTPTTIKVVYQCVPANGVFRNFTFKPKLRDYFPHNDPDGDGYLVYLQDVFVNTNPFFHNFKLRSFKGEQVPVHMLNYTEHQKGIFPAFVVMANGIPCVESTEDGRRFNVSPVAAALHGFGAIHTDTLLKAMGIDTDLMNGPYDNHFTFFKVTVKNDYWLKITLRITKYSGEGTYKSKYTYDPSSPMCSIQIQDNQTDHWDETETKKTYDVSHMFRYTIQKGRAPFAMKVNRIDFLSDPDSPHASSFRHWDEDVAEEKVVINGDEYYINRRFYENEYEFKQAANIVVEEGQMYAGNALRCRYCTLYARVQGQEIDFGNFAENINQMADVPFLTNQLQFLDLETGKFLNQLSLNSRKYKYLRNPMFFSTNNLKSMWGHESENPYTTLTWPDYELKDENIESVIMEVDEDSAPYLRLGYKNGFFGREMVKYLSGNKENDPKEIMHSCITDLAQTNDSGEDLVGPFYYIHDDLYLSNNDNQFKSDHYGSKSLDCFFAMVDNMAVNWWNEDSAYRKTTIYHHDNGDKNHYMWWDTNMVFFWDDSAQYDYFDTYADPHKSYTVVCREYNMAEFVNWHGERFIVNKWKTEDFEKFELELFKIPEIDYSHG